VHVGKLDSPGTCTNALSVHGDVLNAPEHKMNWKQMLRMSEHFERNWVKLACQCCKTGSRRVRRTQRPCGQVERVHGCTKTAGNVGEMLENVERS